MGGGGAAIMLVAGGCGWMAKIGELRDTLGSSRLRA